MMNVKGSKDKHISKWFDRENLIYIRRNSIKKSWRKTKKPKVLEGPKEECINFDIKTGGKLYRL